MSLEVTTELERRLLAAIGGFMGVTGQQPDLAATVLKAAELDQGDVEATFKSGGPANTRFNCVMWNLCNNGIGQPMESHAEIERLLPDRKRRSGDEP